MEEQALELKQNLLNIRNIVIGNRKKIKKVRIKSNTIERISKEKKKTRLKEKLLESSRATGRLITGVGAAIGNVIPKDKKTKLGNALGLFAMFLILKNFDKIKKLISGFLSGDIFKSIKEGIENIKNFFQNIFKGLQMTGNFLGEKYDQFVAFKDERIKDIEKVTQTLKNLGEKFKELNKFAVNLKEKFDNLLQGSQNLSIDAEKEQLEKYGFTDENFNLKQNDDGTYTITTKDDNKISSTFFENLGLTDLDKFQFDKSSFDFGENVIPFDYEGIDTPMFDFSQYNDDETNKETFIYTRTNTILKD
mgnify:FL=1|tara:strand:- start:6847 stop:7764 length:918 start_codon:yes stop_codon:yes gene_type:complete